VPGRVELAVPESHGTDSVKVMAFGVEIAIETAAVRGLSKRTQQKKRKNPKEEA